ncbi:MAG: DUF805 domain-containing protein [Friedmanniella sp.]
MSHPEHEPQNPWSGRGTPRPDQNGYGFEQPGPGYDSQPYPNPYGAQDYPQYGQQDGQAGQPYGQQVPGYGAPAYGYGYGPIAPGAGGEPSLDEPYYGISFGGAIKRGFAKYARFDGRASRSEYWWWVLASSVVFGLLAGVLGGTSADAGSPSAVTSLFAIVLVLGLLAIIVPSIAVTVRRLHDADLSGWLYLLTLIPYAGSLVLLVLTLLPSKPSGARFDRRPPQGGYLG